MNPVSRLWRRADELAVQTPTARNKTVDFLRAASIGFVIFGHWLVAAPYLDASGAVAAGHMLEIAPWTRWLTLVVQVMPIFFLVGGYANAVAWEAAQKKGTRYADWLAARFHRLVAPVIPVLLVWMGIGLASTSAGLSPEWIGQISQVALVPTWFLAVYVMVGVAVPWTHRLWKRFGWLSFAGFVAGAAAVDAVGFAIDSWQLRMLNYGFVWLAIHQLGYAWRDGRFERRLVWGAAGAAALAGLVGFGPYPLAMVGVPGAAVNNAGPPTLALLALGVAQAGFVLALEPVFAKWLARRRIWTGTVLVNGLIMPLYLWHMTAMLAVYALDLALGGAALRLVPDTAVWWATRPLMMAIFFVPLLPLALWALRFEKPATRRVRGSARRLVSGATMVCLGLAVVSELGVVSSQGLRLLPTMLPLVGTGIVGFGPLGGILQREARWTDKG